MFGYIVRQKTKYVWFGVSIPSPVLFETTKELTPIQYCQLMPTVGIFLTVNGTHQRIISSLPTTDDGRVWAVYIKDDVKLIHPDVITKYPEEFKKAILDNTQKGYEDLYEKSIAMIEAASK